MKRSGMIKALQEWLKRCDYPCSAWEFVEQAEDIIEFLETQGMQPPAYEKLVEAKGIVSPSPEMKLFYKKPCNQWEPEEAP